MKNSIVILFLLLLSQLGYGQGRTFKVTARPWVKGQKDLPWKEYDTRTIAQLDGFKATDKVHVNEYGSDWDAPKHRATGFFRVERIGNRWWMIDPDGYRHLQFLLHAYAFSNQPTAFPSPLKILLTLFTN